MRPLERIAQQLAHLCAIIGLTALMFLAFLTMLDGMVRWLFHTSIIGVRDLGSLAIAIGIAACMPIALWEKAHISIHFMRSLLGPRVSTRLSYFSDLLVLVATLVLALRFFTYAVSVSESAQTTAILLIPIAPFWYFVDLLFWIATYVQIIVFLRDYRHSAFIVGA